MPTDMPEGVREITIDLSKCVRTGCDNRWSYLVQGRGKCIDGRKVCGRHLGWAVKLFSHGCTHGPKCPGHNHDPAMISVRERQVKEEE